MPMHGCSAYANATVCARTNQNDEILRFVEFWRAEDRRRRHVSSIFDSRLTTHGNLDRTRATWGSTFVTLRQADPEVTAG